MHCNVIFCVIYNRSIIISLRTHTITSSNYLTKYRYEEKTNAISSWDGLHFCKNKRENCSLHSLKRNNFVFLSIWRMYFKNHQALLQPVHYGQHFSLHFMIKGRTANEWFLVWIKRMIYVIVFKVVTLRMFTFYYFLLYINDAIAVQEIFCKFIVFGYGFYQKLHCRFFRHRV